jgi:N-acetylneuraminate synthase
MEIIAEIGINHNGDLNIAKRLIDVAAFAGCKYVKFQKRTVEDVYSKAELDKPRESPFGKTTREQKHGIEFGLEEYQEIDRYCRGKILWFASPWDVKSLDFLMQFNPPVIKVASAMLTNKPLLGAIVDYNMPVILSTGMSTLQQINEAVATIGKEKIRGLLHCTSTYPTRTEEMNLRCIQWLKRHFPWAKIGFSNHHPGIVFMPAAVALGAEIVEFHVTLDKTMYGSDQAASFNPEGVIKACKYMRAVYAALGDGKKRIYDSEKPIIEKLRPI